MSSRSFFLLGTYSTPTQKDVTKGGENLCSWMLEKSKKRQEGCRSGDSRSHIMEGASKLILEEAIFYKQAKVEEGKGTEKGDNAQSMFKAD